MARLLTPLVIASLSLGLGACSPFSPELPEESFLCGADDACPAGFECVEVSASRRVCQADGSSPSTPDAGTGPCQNEGSPLEPNETIAMAFATPVARTMASFALSDIAICPATDVDTYQIDIPANNTNLTVDINFDAGISVLTLDILSTTGARVAMGGTVTAGNVRATVSNLAQGFYYAQVKAPVDGENEYRINFVTSP